MQISHWNWLPRPVLLCTAVVLLLAVPPGAAASNAPGVCSIEETKRKLNDVPEGLWKALLGTVFKTRTACGSLANALASINSKSVSGGRKLSEDVPLDREAANKQLLEARQDPAYRTALEAEVQLESDPLLHMLREAALLDDFGYRLARDLIAANLLERLPK